MWDIIIIVGLVLSSIVGAVAYREEDCRKVDGMLTCFFIISLSYAVLVGIGCAIINFVYPHTGLKILYVLIPFVVIPIGINYDKLIKFSIKIEKKG